MFSPKDSTSASSNAVAMAVNVNKPLQHRTVLSNKLTANSPAMHSNRT
jgi:hypothetical protein